MHLRTRRIFFWSLIPVFVVGGATAVLYSQGYRINPKTHQVTKVGALYVRGYPRSAKITLDGKPINTGSWWPLQSGTLDNSLVPGTYALHAEAPGYRSWDADVVIRPSLVTERKSLVLFPDIAVPVATSTGFAPVSLDTSDSFDGPIVISNDENPRVAVDGSTVPGTYIGTVNGRLALISQVKRGKALSELLTLQSPESSTATTVSLQGEMLTQPQVFDDSILNRESKSLIAAYDGSTGKRTIFATSSADASVGAILRTGSIDAWAVNNATGSTLFVQRRGSINRISLPFKTIVSLQQAGSAVGVLDQAGSLWLVNVDAGSKQEVGHSASYASWKDDGSAVAAVINGEIEVIAIKKDAPHGKLKGMLNGNPVNKLVWYPDGEHLIIETTDSLLFADVIENESGAQHVYRMPGVIGGNQWAYSAKNATLYVIKNGEVLSYVFPN